MRPSLTVAFSTRGTRALGLDTVIVPGVSSFSAAAAALGKELTLPELSQTVILTRAEGRTPMPAGEKLDELIEIHLRASPSPTSRPHERAIPGISPTSRLTPLGHVSGRNETPVGRVFVSLLPICPRFR